MIEHLQAAPNDLTTFVGWAAAVRAADAGGDRDDQTAARFGLLRTADSAVLARADRVLPAFAWLLADHDGDPDRGGAVSPASLGWLYPFLLHAAAHDPAVSRARLADLFQDCEQRLRGWGLDLTEAHAMRKSLLDGLGRPDRIPAVGRLAARCSAAADRHVPFWIGFGFCLLRVAWPTATPEQWATSPSTTGDGGYEPPGTLAERLQLTVRDCITGSPSQAVLKDAARLLRRALRLAPFACGMARLDLYAAAASAGRTLHENGERIGRFHLPEDLPEDLSGGRRGRRVDLPVLAVALDAEADRLAVAFDRRNGNGVASGRLRQVRAFVAGRAYHW